MTKCDTGEWNEKYYASDILSEFPMVDLLFHCHIHKSSHSHNITLQSKLSVKFKSFNASDGISMLDEFPTISINKFRTFYDVKIASHLKKMIQP